METRDRIRILIVDDVAETRENLRKLLSFANDMEVVGAASSGQEGIDLAKQLRPDIILMDINMPGMDGITATEVIMQAVPTTQVVVLSVQGESDYLRRAMLAGARDFLTKPPSGDELMSTLRQVHETGKKRVAMMPAQQAVSTAAPVARRGPSREGRIVAIYSPKGGTGCTTIAVNLAIALQQLTGSANKIGLMDANFQFGDVGVMLNLSPSRSIADLTAQIEDLDSDMLSSALSAHGSGIKVLLAPPHPAAADALLATSTNEGSAGSSLLKPILGLMRREFDIVVADTWGRIDDITLAIFDAAAMIVLVVTPSIPSIKSARLFLEVANQLNYPLDEISLVVNCVDRRTGIRVDQIEQALTLGESVAQVPLDDQMVIAAANRGTPFVMRDQNRPISQGVFRLAEHILEQVKAAEEEAAEAEDESMAAGAGRLRLGRIFG